MFKRKLTEPMNIDEGREHIINNAKQNTMRMDSIVEPTLEDSENNVKFHIGMDIS